MSTKSCANWHGEPSTTKNSSSSRAPKNWRSTPGQPGGARKIRKTAKSPVHRRHNSKKKGNPVHDAEPVSVAQLEGPQTAR